MIKIVQLTVWERIQHIFVATEMRQGQNDHNDSKTVLTRCAFKSAHARKYHGDSRGTDKTL